jgi:hypothetical protein
MVDFFYGLIFNPATINHPFQILFNPIKLHQRTYNKV